jgi:hypothetical protein
LKDTGVSVRSMDDGAHARWAGFGGNLQGHSVKHEERY